MKQKYITRYKKRKGFSLLELLVVVAIMAIIGGAVITAYDGLVSQSQKATATNTIGSLTNSVRQFKVVEGNYPNNWESLMSAKPLSVGTFNAANGDTEVSVQTVLTLADGTVVTQADIDAGTVAAADVTTTISLNDELEEIGKAGILASKIADKFTVTDLNNEQVAALASAGITKLRFTHTDGDDETESVLNNIFTAGNEANPNVGELSKISIPQHAFEAPRAGTDRNRGRGFVGEFGSSTTSVPAMVWNKGTEGYNNIKVGATPDAVLVGLGIGNASTLVDPSGNSGDQSAPVGSISLATAPFYGDVAKNTYQHYVALFDVAQSPAVFVAIVDSRGDFLDEEFAESTGQKK